MFSKRVFTSVISKDELTDDVRIRRRTFWQRPTRRMLYQMEAGTGHDACVSRGTPKMPDGQQKLEGARNGPPRAFRESVALLLLSLGRLTSATVREEIHVAVSHLVYGNSLWHPQGINTTALLRKILKSVNISIDARDRMTKKYNHY